MKIQQNISLKPYNTFGLDVNAKYFIDIENTNTLKDILKGNSSQKLFIMGGGSNMLLTKDIEKTVLKINLKGIKVINEDENHVWIEAQAGENWHEFVLWCIDNNYGGVENLSLIPGNVGTTPIQNIGAYGVEIKDVLDYCTAMNIANQDIVTFSNEDCQFGYRESIFKNAAKDQYIVLSVVFKLTKKEHVLKTGYGSIQEELDQQNITNPTIQDISKIVISIRQNKLPNPSEIGNSGSFFKNPIIDIEQFNTLQKKYPNIPHYTVNEQSVKIPAGWLIEQIGFKGYRLGDTGVHEKQALVLINYGNAKGHQIEKLAQIIQDQVKAIFGISITPEVNIF
ncbi:UDP-N-acetylmuramate dehydrogenase [Myroides pelagicus]|uniref:UDP-N-acetylenolpyruvoylglucosamine reductase n=1 Tax=Myroides pelagicus TaxID=270914 RepID=A0A7K1GPY9_9FLAO|nr:UDP-N-acetylmuramate dehydrogenase [Myroides pelagicus]MEC4114031.1 UDP-N-acetylmuramate dehydrogenase [Myroides pelagicus]MTH30975.1 UDP-N-acetylmuramate dehydrogenase [Myroides pelagicus]